MTPEEVKEEYFPNTSRKNLRLFIDQKIIKNNSEAANEIGLSRGTIHKYQSTFKQMSGAERNLLIKALADKNHSKFEDKD